MPSDCHLSSLGVFIFNVCQLIIIVGLDINWFSDYVPGTTIDTHIISPLTMR